MKIKTLMLKKYKKRFIIIMVKKMKNYLENYINEIDNKIKNKDITKEDIKNHLNKISFFQHERQIHLLVTLFYTLYLFISIIIFLKIWQFVFIIYLIITILIFYVKHYFFLENNVQYLCKQYDKMIENKKKIW